MSKFFLTLTSFYIIICKTNNYNSIKIAKPAFCQQELLRTSCKHRTTLQAFSYTKKASHLYGATPNLLVSIIFSNKIICKAQLTSVSAHNEPLQLPQIP